MTTTILTSSAIRGFAVPLDGDTPIQADTPPVLGDLTVRVNGVAVGTGTKDVDAWANGYPFSWTPASTLADSDVVTLELALTIGAVVRVHREQWTAITISGGGSGLTAQQTRDALGMASANLDGQLAAINDKIDNTPQGEAH